MVPTHPAPTSSSLLLSPLLPFFFFFLSSSFFFSFSGMMLSIQARSCWEKTKSRSRLTKIRAKIYEGRDAKVGSARASPTSKPWYHHGTKPKFP